MCQNSRHPEGKQVFTINHVVYTYVWAQFLSVLGMVGNLPKSEFPVTSQLPTCQRITVRPVTLTLLRRVLLASAGWRPGMPPNLCNAQVNSPQQRITGSKCQQCCCGESLGQAERASEEQVCEVSSAASGPLSFLRPLDLNSIYYVSSL